MYLQTRVQMNKGFAHVDFKCAGLFAQCSAVSVVDQFNNKTCLLLLFICIVWPLTDCTLYVLWCVLGTLTVLAMPSPRARAWTGAVRYS